MFNLGDKVRLIGDSHDNVGGQIRGIQRTDDLNDRDETVVTVSYRVITPNGSFMVNKDQMSHETPKNKKFANAEEAEAWMNAQAGNSWTDSADDFLASLLDDQS